MLELEGRTAIVTGGGSNIGQAIAIGLAEQGADVMIADIDPEGAQGTTEMIQQRGGEAMFVEADVTEESAVKRVRERTQSAYGDTDVLINNVGGGDGGALHNTTREGFDTDVERTLTSAFLCTRELLPDLRESDDSSVVFISSINALLGGFDQVAYTAAKGGIHSMARKLVADYSTDGIRFNVVCAGSVIGDAEVWEERAEEAPDSLESLTELYPLGRFGAPEDVANLVVFLSSAAAEWITGAIIPVDGGLTATGNLPGENWWEEI
jgi:NAD(P)-dependent dehydrogenase (short-subunit alcohol dehydrogenase family)